MQNHIEFNTGCGYSAHGQHIDADVVETQIVDGHVHYRVHFKDKTRHINGEVWVSEFTQRAIMFAYDGGNYKEV